MIPVEILSLLIQLKKMVQSDDRIERLSGLSEQQLDKFVQLMPNQILPLEIKELLRYLAPAFDATLDLENRLLIDSGVFRYYSSSLFKAY